jgi:hypothetical protein
MPDSTDGYYLTNQNAGANQWMSIQIARRIGSDEKFRG